MGRSLRVATNPIGLRIPTSAKAMLNAFEQMGHDLIATQEQLRQKPGETIRVSLILLAECGDSGGDG